MRPARIGRAVAALATSVAMAAGAVVAASAPPGAAPAGAVGRASGPLAPTGDGTLFGAHVQAPDGTTEQSVVTDLEARLGRRLGIDHSYRPWGKPFPDGHEAWDIANGRIPMVSWGKVPAGEVVAGQHDAEALARARAVRDFGQPILLRWFWEMAGDRNRDRAGSPQDYVAAWQHLHALFDREGATNAVWVWCPDASDFADGTAQSYYPGDDWVDWTCADGYNYHHPAKRGTRPRSFEETFSAFYAWSESRPKPMMVGEYGTVEDNPGDKAAWVGAAREAVKRRFPKLGAVVYYNSLRDKDGLAYDWRMESTPESMAAFAAMAADPWFNPSVVITLPDTKIDGGPEGAVGAASKDASFSFSATNPAGGFECRLDGAAYEACGSPKVYPGLADGHHRFEVRAKGPDGRPDPTPAGREWDLDATPPGVTAVTPADGSASEATDTSITATFSEDVDPATVTAGAFTVVNERSGAAVAGRVSYDPATRRATFRPDSALFPVTAYRATVAATVADKVGNRMGAPKQWGFSTGGLGLPLLGGGLLG